ncbi:MAG: hypothetical protein LBT00_08140 [Spirochaetaceae bacterium]|nr:hypothetical protein [Spirochaetaceae bacterium]
MNVTRGQRRTPSGLLRRSAPRNDGATVIASEAKQSRAKAFSLWITSPLRSSQ